MIPSEEYPRIAQALLEKTRQAKAKWAWGTPPGCYFLELPHSRIGLKYECHDTEFDHIRLFFQNSDGLEVTAWDVADGTPDWPLAKELYEEVHRNVTGWDKVLADVETFLASDGKNAPAAGGGRH